MNVKIFSILLFLLSACSGLETPPSDSGIEGQVFIGPMCPVVREGEECPDKPYQATLTITNPKGERIVQVQTDEEGRFRILLHAGEYVLHPESPSAYPFAGEQTVIVQKGQFTQVIVNYDSGIR
ncbi:MAG TPA: carboxypeptidase-like regulatory domain-containing protein [Anaerolineales bacterium]|nr:carboxypeptidase-like regulatory domain-containing protein [Anaerolineales bacterium]